MNLVLVGIARDRGVGSPTSQRLRRAWEQGFDMWAGLSNAHVHCLPLLVMAPSQLCLAQARCSCGV